MELEQLRQLVEIDRLGTISAAAEELHITQPALSRSVRRLETDLGQSLFDRGHNSVALNEAGKLAVHHAKRILADVRLMRDDFDALSQRERTIKIASVGPAPTWCLTERVVEEFPRIIITPQLMDEVQAENALINRDVDFAILDREPALPTFQSIPLMGENLFALIPQENPLSKRSSVSFAELDEQPFLLFKGIGGWMNVVRTHLPHSQFIVQEDREVFLGLLEKSDLLAFSSDAPRNEVEVKGRVRIPITDSSARVVYFLVASKDIQGSASDVFQLMAAQEPTNLS